MAFEIQKRNVQGAACSMKSTGLPRKLGKKWGQEMELILCVSGGSELLEAVSSDDVMEASCLTESHYHGYRKYLNSRFWAFFFFGQ